MRKESSNLIECTKINSRKLKYKNILKYINYVKVKIYSVKQ